MKTSHKILIPTLSVLLAGAIALVALTFNGTLKRKPGPEGEVVDGVYTSVDFAQLNPASVQSKFPCMQTDIENIFYSIDRSGNVSFYEYDGENFDLYKGPVYTLNVYPELTYNKIPIKISYIVKDGKTTGYGLFTNAGNAGVNLYTYVFAKLTDAPAVYGISGKMLLLSLDPNEAYKSDKTYVEIFNVDITNGGLSRIFSQRDRGADKTGRFADRWHILTDGFLKSCEKKAAVISGRLYNEETEVYDIYDLNRSMNHPDTTGMYGTFLRENPKDNSYIYLKKTVQGFKTVSYMGQENELIRFDGDINKDYVFSDNWIYSAKEHKFTNLVTSQSFVAKNIEAIDMFAVNSDASKFAVAATYKDGQAFFIVDKDGKVQGYSGENIFNSNVENICFIGKDAVMITTVNNDGSCTNNVVKVK